MQQPARDPRAGGRGLANLGEHRDENELGVSAGTIFGLKKTQFNSQDFATIVMSSWAVAH
jgi:hypothetical protein